MTAITSEMIKNLREMTSAGMMDCKKALTEAGSNMDDAVDWLRKKGLSAAAKKSGRVAAEGLIAIATSGTSGAVIELNAETDFVGRNEQFQTLAKTIADIAVKAGDDVEALKKAGCPSGRNVADEVTHSISTIGENMSLRRAKKLSVSKGVVASYVHNSVAPGLGKIGILVALESDGDTSKLETLGKQLAMHIAASNPIYLMLDEVTPQIIKTEEEASAERIGNFIKSFHAFEAGSAKYQAQLTKDRAFSEKTLEAKLAELQQTLPNVDELLSDFERQNASEDRKEKSNAEKTKKLLDIFFQETTYLLKKVKSYGDDNAIRARLKQLYMDRFFEESVLSEQVFVVDGRSKISQVLADAAKDVGAPVKLTGFVRFALGEGVEKEVSDFAAEVAKAAGAA